MKIPQQNEIEQIKKEMNLLQEKKRWSNNVLLDRLKKNEKSQNQFQNGLMQIKRIRVKKGQRLDIFQNKIEQIKKNTNLLEIIPAQVKKRKR